MLHYTLYLYYSYTSEIFKNKKFKEQQQAAYHEISGHQNKNPKEKNLKLSKEKKKKNSLHSKDKALKFSKQILKPEHSEAVSSNLDVYPAKSQ